MSKLHPKTIGHIINRCGDFEMRKNKNRVFHDLLNNHGNQLTPAHLYAMQSAVDSSLNKKIVSHPAVNPKHFNGLEGHYAAAILNHLSKFGSDEVKQIAKRRLETGE